MRTLISDVLDLYRFRVKALPAYYYPLWKIALLLTAIGFVTSSTATDLGSYIPGRIAFCIVYNWLETLLYCGVIGLWLKLSHFKLNRPLLVLVALSSGIQFLAPLVSWLPDDVASIVLLVLLFYSLLVLCYALERVTGMRRLRVVSGVMLCLLLSGVLMQSSQYVSSRLGWVSRPASWWNPLSVTAPTASSDPLLSGVTVPPSNQVQIKKEDTTDDDWP